MAAFARHEADTVQTGKLLDIARTHLDVGTRDYLKNVLVLGQRDGGTAEHCVVDWLVDEHPDPDVTAEWVTGLDAYDKLLSDLEVKSRSQLHRTVQQFVGAAMGSPAHMLEGPIGDPTVTNMTDSWEDIREVAIEEGAIHPVAAKIVKEALYHLEGSSQSRGRLDNVGRLGRKSWEEFWDDWGTTAEGLVEWYEGFRDEGTGIDDGIRDDVVSSLAQYEPDELCKPDGDDTDHEGEEELNKMDAYRDAEPSEDDGDDDGRGAETQRTKPREVQERELVNQINDER